MLVRGVLNSWLTVLIKSICVLSMSFKLELFLNIRTILSLYSKELILISTVLFLPLLNSILFLEKISSSEKTFARLIPKTFNSLFISENALFEHKTFPFLSRTTTLSDTLSKIKLYISTIVYILAYSKNIVN